MSEATILYGTESGNAEMAADDVAASLTRQGISCQIVGMDEYEVADLVATDFAIVITSTYGEGELPETAGPFHQALLAIRPNLASLRFAAFGLGDSTYETFCNGVDTLSTTLRHLGATQIGETGRHDAAGGADLTAAVTDWAETVFVAA